MTFHFFSVIHHKKNEDGDLDKATDAMDPHWHCVLLLSVHKTCETYYFPAFKQVLARLYFVLLWEMDVKYEYICDGRLRLHKVIGDSHRLLLKKIRDHVDSGKFPGPNPVSLERSNFPTLQTKLYWLCEKTDGIRFALCCFEYNQLNMSVLMDRSFSLYLFPLHHTPTAMFQGTILDGEVAYNKTTKRWTFLIFDALDVSGIPMHTLPFSQRMACVQKALAPYKPEVADPALLCVKKFIPSCIASSFKEHMGSMQSSYDIDGVILTPEDDGIVFGRHMGMFKLKTHHTVDFEVASDGNGLMVYDFTKQKSVIVAKLPSHATPGTVVECELLNDDCWKVCGVRQDKSTANDMLTYSKTLLNIRECITLDEVLDVWVCDV